MANDTNTNKNPSQQATSNLDDMIRSNTSSPKTPEEKKNPTSSLDDLAGKKETTPPIKIPTKPDVEIQENKEKKPTPVPQKPKQDEVIPIITTNPNTPASVPTRTPSVLSAIDVGEASPEETIISRINAQESGETQEEGINLDKFTIAENQGKNAKIILGKSGVNLLVAHKRRILPYWKILIISLATTIIMALASLILGSYNYYLTVASEPIIEGDEQTYVQKYQSVQKTVQKTLGNAEYERFSNLNLAAPTAQQDVNDLLQAKKINYIDKKMLIQKGIDSFTPIFIANKDKLEQIKQEVTKYGFLPQELSEILQEQDGTMSVKDSLLALEMIKFTSAMKVFSYLDTFVSSVSSVLNISVGSGESQLKILTDRGEKDIALYLNNCYLNPYEVDYNCKFVGDFDRYYNVVSKETIPFDKEFFKKVMFFIDSKLEQSVLPSFAITFQKFDPKGKEISFKVDVNTFQQDEAALSRKKIINPHIFVVSNLLNLIKQSLFVISENIDVKQLKITPKIIKIGTTIFTLNSSTMDFVLPIQKQTQREISDYAQPKLLDISK